MSRPARVTRAQVPSSDDPVRFRAGDRVSVERADPDAPGCLWVVGAEGHSGWVFGEYLSGTSGEVTGLRDYDATGLAVQPGDHGAALEDADGWWLCQLADGRRGWIRTSHLEIP